MEKKSLISLIAGNFFRNFSITNWLIVINIAAFLIFSIIIAVNPDFINYIALKSTFIFHGEIWLLLTSMFMHANLVHLFVNMFSLFFIGNFLEKIIGRKRFLVFFLMAGLFAGIVFAFLSYFFGYGFLAKIFTSPDTIAVGASGAIFGLLGLLAVLTPKAKVYLIAGPLIAIILQSILQVFFQGTFMNIIDFLVMVYFFIAIFSMFTFSRFKKIGLPVEMPFWLLPIVAILPLIVIGLFVELPIGNTAHLGGLIAGLLYGWYLRNKYKKKILLLNRMMAR